MAGSPAGIYLGYFLLVHFQKSPLVEKSFGTVGITSVGMFGKGSGWAIPFGLHTLDIALGGMAEKPGVVEGQIEIREYLCMTLSFDHDIIDGAPAARFTQRLKELIESGYGIEQFIADKCGASPGRAAQAKIESLIEPRDRQL